MRKSAVKNTSLGYVGKGLGVLLLMSTALLLTSCQGVSNATPNNSTPNPPSSAGQLTVSPATLAIGNVVNGTTGSGSGQLTASGNSVTITAASSGSSAFSISGLSLPLTLQAGKSTSFTVAFSPQASGAASATLTFTSNAQTPSITESATGTGTAASSHSVDLSWNPSSSSNISGYNVYRAVYTSSCGSFSRINSSLNASTVYTDSNVTDGTSYCYAATAVDTSNAESGYSNIVSPVQIPIP